MRYKGGKVYTSTLHNITHKIDVKKNPSNNSYRATVGKSTYNAKILPSVAPSVVSRVAPLAAMAAPLAAMAAQNIPMNEILTPKQAAQKGINFMLDRQKDRFERPNNNKATINAANAALTFSQARNNQQAKNQASRNQQNAIRREEAAKQAENRAKTTSNIWHNQEKKRQEEENSILLPKKPSNMAPLQIAGQLEKDLQQLEGPVYASVLVPNSELERILGRKPPVFLLLGDIHQGINKCESCAQPGCYSLYKNKGKDNNRSTFLDYLDDQTKKNWIIDVFFESWAGKRERKSPDRHLSHAAYLQGYDPNKREEYDRNTERHTSAIADWHAIFSNCVGYIQNPYNNRNDPCNYKHFRIHDSDVRKYGTIDDIHADNSFGLIMKHMCTRIIEWDKQNLSTLFSYFSVIISQFMPGRQVNVLQFINIIDDIYIKDSTIKDIIKTENFQKYSRTVHELRQLPPELYDGLINNPELGFALNNSTSDNKVKRNRFAIQGCIKTIKMLNNVSQSAFTKTIETEQIRNEMDTFQKNAKITLEMLGININLETRLVDLYTISRVLKSFKKGYETSLYSQLAVCYFGASHTQYTELLLKQWYTPHVIWGTRNLELLFEQLENPKKTIKCIKQIKNDSDDTMYPESKRLYNIIVSDIEYELGQYYDKSSTTLQADELAIYIKIGKITQNEAKAFAAFDPLEAFLIEKNKGGLLMARAKTDRITLLKNFIKRYEELYPEQAASTSGGRKRKNQTRKNRIRRSTR